MPFVALQAGSDRQSLCCSADSDMYKIQLGHDNTHDVSLSKYLDGEITIDAQRHEVLDVISCDEAR